MRLSAIQKFYPAIKFKNQNSIKNNSNLQLNSLNKDTVSFCSKTPINSSFGPNIKDSVSMGVKIYDDFSKNTKLDEIVSQIQSEYPQLRILSIKELSIPDSESYSAFYEHTIGDDFLPIKPKMYIDFSKAHRDSNWKLFCAMDIAHEYSHVAQSYSEEIQNEFRIISNGDEEYAKVIAGLGDSIFKLFDTNIQARFLMGNFRTPQDAKSIMTYGRLLPIKADMNRGIMLQKSPYANDKEFKKEMSLILQEATKTAIGQVFDGSAEITPELKARMYEEIDKFGVEKLISDIRKYCAQSAKREKEAYAVESQLARTILKTNESLNIDCFPLYYEMLESAFNRGL